MFSANEVHQWLRHVTSFTFFGLHWIMETTCKHQYTCQPTEIISATILWLKISYVNYLFKTNENKLHEFSKLKDRYFSFLCIFYLKAEKDRNGNSGGESPQNCFSSIGFIYNKTKTNRVTEGNVICPCMSLENRCYIAKSYL